jgi:hypothetical protein
VKDGAETKKKRERSAWWFSSTPRLHHPRIISI